MKTIDLITAAQPRILTAKARDTVAAVDLLEATHYLYQSPRMSHLLALPTHLIVLAGTKR
jgi:hypothetical protein